MQVQPYLSFEGRCDEAIAFYRKALGAEVRMLMRFKDNPEPPKSGACAPSMGEKVMHANVGIGDSTVFMSDGQCAGAAKFDGFSLSLTVGSDDQAKRYFAALSDGGKVRMPLAKTFFSSNFGMVADRFGVNWMVYVQA
jgi:PhnB protein